MVQMLKYNGNLLSGAISLLKISKINFMLSTKTLMLLSIWYLNFFKNLIGPPIFNPFF